ncbi:MAG TPA: AbiTii domain-containing protein, partial [Xylella taiwanensis]
DAALDRTVSLAHLLRLALVAASRLELPALAAWINEELNGYSSDEEVPDYRRVWAPFIAKDPVKGFVPLNLPPDISKEFAQLSVIQSIHELGQFAQRKTEACFLLNPEVERILMEIMRPSSGVMGRPLYLLSNEKLHEILEKVRDKVLQWALDLKTQGVLGKGRIFSAEEKQIVKNYHFFGDIKNSNVQIGTIGSNQTHTHTAGDMDALLSLIECLRTALEQGAV